MKLDFFHKIILIASISGALAVIMGAFGAHALQEIISTQNLKIYQTAVTYHFYHTLALVATAWLSSEFHHSKWLKLSCGLFILGILLFSGSLYLLSLREVVNLGYFKPVLGPVTPLGGACFITGWLFIGVQVINIRRKK